MPLNALKAQWVVKAGIIPGVEDLERRKVWQYTSEDSEEDSEADRLHPPEAEWLSRFETMRNEASDYARLLNDPRILNWVTVEFLWL